MSGQAIPPHGTYSPPAAAAAYRMALAIMAAELEAPELEAIALEVHARLEEAGDDPVAVLAALEEAYLEHLSPRRPHRLPRLEVVPESRTRGAT